MAYIRCLSNPESLYVWGDVDGNTYISWNDKCGVAQMYGIPSKDFDECFRRLKVWEKENALWEKSFKYAGIEIAEVNFEEISKRILCDEELDNLYKVSMWERNVKIEHLIALSYKENQLLLLWEVTWEYFKQSVYESLYQPPWFLRKLNQWFGNDSSFK